MANWLPTQRNVLLCLFVSVRSAEFSNFIAKCLVKDPDLRSSASDLLEVVCCVK